MLKRLGAMTAMALLAAVAAFMPGSTAFADDSPKSGNEIPRVVLLAPTGPLLVDIKLETGSKTIRQVRDEFCDSLFIRLDTDKSGKLETAEQGFLPLFRRAGGGMAANASTFAVDGVMSLEGLKKYIDSQLGPLFSVEITPPRADETVQLLEALDADHDGVLSVEEITRSSAALTHFDLDDDESLSVNELQPFPRTVRDAQRRQTVDSGRAGRLFQMSEEGASQNMLAAVARLYAADKGLALDRCGLKGATTAFDENGDGRLEGNELTKWMATAPADLQISAVWRSSGGIALPPLLTMSFPPTNRVAPGKGVSKFRWEALLDGVPTTLSVSENRGGARSDAVSLFVSEARRNDADKNGYLSETEFAALRSTSPFSAVDLNHDAMVTFDEIREFFTMSSQISQTRVIMTFNDEVTSLFQLMDADKSNRLSPREMMTLRDRLTPFDRNHNGRFEADDFVSRYSLTIAFAKPEGVFFTPNQMQSNSQTGGVRKLSRTGPLWYQRMDRNKDGDISWREFLGPRLAFDKLDADHDGLISREEAEAADASAVPAATTAGP